MSSANITIIPLTSPETVQPERQRALRAGWALKLGALALGAALMAGYLLAAAQWTQPILVAGF